MRLDSISVLLAPFQKESWGGFVQYPKSPTFRLFLTAEVIIWRMRRERRGIRPGPGAEQNCAAHRTLSNKLLDWLLI